MNIKVKTKIIFIELVVLIVGITAFSSIAFAGDPLEEDENFLLSDPDNDTIMTWEEFLLGTDPFNSDSDNDGLPDDWEKGYISYGMNPADASDSHLDFDYDSSSNASGYNIGECEANFSAVQKAMDIWPCNRFITFKQVIEDFEEDPHYDNYEEYYRPYTDLKNRDLIRYMHTSPVDSDTDDDGLLDPDDFEPLGYSNDGLSPGGIDAQNVDIDINLDHDYDKNIGEKMQIDDDSVHVDGLFGDLSLIAQYDIDIINIIEKETEVGPKQIKPNSDHQTPSDPTTYILMVDADNDGIDF